MTGVRNLIGLAALLAGLAAPARANFVFDVTVDTAAASGQGSFNFQFVPDAAGAGTLTLSNLTYTGMLAGGVQNFSLPSAGDVAVTGTAPGPIAAAYTADAQFVDLFQDATLGGLLSFRVASDRAGTFNLFVLGGSTAAFIADPASVPNLLSNDGGSGPALSIANNTASGGVDVAANPAVTAVPEPSSLLLVGLAGAAAVARRRARKAA